MPNYGGPNGSCSECLRRKVKCDQTYPSCRRCIRRNTICPGVKDRATQIWRHETRKTVAKLVFPGQQGGSSQVDSKDEAAAICRPDQSSIHGENLAHLTEAKDLTKELSTNVLSERANYYENIMECLRAPSEDVLVAFFFDQIACRDVGWYMYLPNFHRQTARDGYLNASIQAASLFVMANQRQDHPSLMVQARSSYSKALASLNSAIGDEKERLLDAVLCTILIFSIIEDITGNSDSFHDAHLSGLQRLLRLRKSLGIKNMLGAEIWNAVAMRSQSLILRTANHDPRSSEILLPQMLASPALLTHSTCGAVRQFIDCATKSINNDEPCSNRDASFVKLLNEGERLELALRYWCQEEYGELLAAERWKRYVAAVLLDPHSASDLEYYASVQTAEMWNENRCARIYLHQALQALSTYILAHESMSRSLENRSGVEAIMAQSGHVIDEMVQNICNSIPFHMQRIGSTGKICTDQSQRVAGGTALIRPLEVVLSCSRSSVTQKTLARDTLFEIGHSIGVKKALMIVGE